MLQWRISSLDAAYIAPHGNTAPRCLREAALCMHGQQLVCNTKWLSIMVNLYKHSCTLWCFEGSDQGKAEYETGKARESRVGT